MATISQLTQQPEITGAFIDFYTLDATAIGGTITRFTPGVNEKGTFLVWQGFVYTPLPIESSEFDTRGDGAQAKPKLVLSNVNKVLLASVISLGDLIGAKLTRQRTFSHYIDAVNFTSGTNPTADPNAYFPADVYYVEQKVGHDNQNISWSLTSPLERFSIKLPRRQITRQGDLRYGGFPGLGTYRTR